MKKMLFAACGIALLALPATVSARWIEAKNTAFTVYGAGNEALISALSDDLSRYDAALRQELGVRDSAGKAPLTIYLVGTRKEAGRLASGSNDSNIAGWYNRHAEGGFAVSNLEGWAANAKSVSRSVLLHEYTHHLLNRYATIAMPAWLSEGTAELYSTMTFDANGQAIVGQFPQVRAKSMAQKNQLPIETLLFASPMQITNNVHREQFYNRAWLLTHMLHFDAVWKPRLAQYFAALNGGTDARQAAANAFGDFNALNAALDQYAKRPVQSRTIVVDGTAPPATTLRVMARVEAQLTHLRLERKAAGRDAGRLAVVQRDLATLAHGHGGDADVQYELAQAGSDLINARKSRGEGIDALRAQMQDALDKSLALRADHADANLLQGQLLMDQLRHQGSTDGNAWQCVRAAIQKSIAANGNNPIALKAYYESYIGERRPASQNAVSAIAKAFDMVPELSAVRVAYAWSLARAGDLAGAERAVQIMAFDPQDSGSGRMLAVQFAGMRKLQASAEVNPAMGG